MEDLVKKYTEKLYIHGITPENAPVFGALETDVFWNREYENLDVLQKIFDSLNINTLLFSELAEPYKTIVDYLAKTSDGPIVPQDSETRTFLHDLPVAKDFSAASIVPLLKDRKSAIIPGHGIITFGMVSPEQAFVHLSSVCFSCFVKFFADFLNHKKKNKTTKEEEKAFETAASALSTIPSEFDPLIKGPYKNSKEVYTAVAEAGKLTVDYKLVDSYFGNVSCKHDNVLYISQTTSSLDELDGMIDPCPLDYTTCAGVTASTELPAHMIIVKQEPEIHTILHGHPKFSVIMSIDCDAEGCEFEGLCYKSCPHTRWIEDIPIVPGESGTGKFGLVNTMPPAVKGRKAAIVYGHGVFSTGKVDFNESFANLLYTETLCKNEFFRRVNK